MSTVQPTAQSTAPTGPRNQQGWRGRGRQRARGGQGPRNQPDVPLQSDVHADSVPTALRPPQLRPAASTEPSSAEASATEFDGGSVRGQSQGPRGRRGKGRGRGVTNNGHDGQTRTFGRGLNHNVAHSGRARPFGTNLNGDDIQQGHAASPLSGLQADAPEFVPGKVHHTRPPNKEGSVGKAQATPAVTRRRKISIGKSQAQDIATRTHEDIANGVYECPICTSEVTPRSRIWSCKTCWTVFHLTCVRKWSTNEGSTQAQQRNADGEVAQPRQWRCPGCNLPKDTIPSNYACWCGKESDPRPIPGVPPHSCGQTCTKPRILPRKCDHPCELTCHAGPCPPCKHVLHNINCHCGKRAMTRKCIEGEIWTCEEICNDVMPCGNHRCSKVCHEGSCGQCTEPMACRCYCGKNENVLPCSERDEEKQSYLTSSDMDRSSVEAEAWIGSFNCHERCHRPFDCGKHHCEKKCHPQEAKPAHCPLSADVISHCSCGKTRVQDLLPQPRTSCTDSIPSCNKQCGKQRSCGHLCPDYCHARACKPCSAAIEVSCRCGRTKHKAICHQASEDPPQCTRTCKAMLNCGRHECGERCCPGERKAAGRQATRKKLRSLNAFQMMEDGIEAEHICTRPCGRLLKCGGHACPELCHRGPCGSCREAIFDELSCHCGKTVLQPPLPCGTSPPPCRFDCERPKHCIHPRVPHNCHGDNEKCPKCPFLSQKPCLCGKKVLKNQPCFATEVRCGEICGAKLRCGAHTCRKQCHRPGQCEDAGTKCQQQCGKTKKACDHPCDDLCHAPSSCKEEKSCQHKMIVTCECQNLKQEVKCNASKSSDGNSKKNLPCDDECAKLARNHRLADALNIDPETHTNDHVPYSSETMKLYRDNLKWAQTQEREMRIFAADEEEKRLRFKPAPPHQRAFLHSLAEDFGFDSESIDPEPHRHVLIFKTPRFVKAPMKTLAQCFRIRMSQAPAAPTEEPVRRTEPFNGFLLLQPRFALTAEELRADFLSAFQSTPGLAYDISFGADEQVLIKARPASASTAISATAVEASIKALKPILSSITASKHLAHSSYLCTLDGSMNIIRRESDSKVGSDGWSRVAAKGAAPKTLIPKQAVGQKSGFTVLGSRIRGRRMKEKELQKEDVVDDWEEEVEKAEKELETVYESQSRQADVSMNAELEAEHQDLPNNE